MFHEGVRHRPGIPFAQELDGTGPNQPGRLARSDGWLFEKRERRIDVPRRPGTASSDKGGRWRAPA